MLAPKLDVVIRPNQVSIRAVATGQIATVEAPFSCDHLLADDVAILEHAVKLALGKVARQRWSFPRITVSTSGRPIHSIERRVIKDALLNAGASRVIFGDSAPSLNEQASARGAYIEAERRRANVRR